MARKKQDSPRTVTAPFECEGVKQYVEVVDGWVVRRCRYRSKQPIEETTCEISRSGCAIEEIAVSPSGTWLVTQRFSGQGEWGYDVFRTAPLTRVGGISEEKGYILDLPAFAEDESWLVGGAGLGFLGGWWSLPGGDPEEPARGGLVSLGFLFVHRLPSHKVTRHPLKVKLPRGWLPEDPWDGWLGPREIRPTRGGVRLVPSWGIPVEIAAPLPRVILLPTPHPSGKGLL